MKRFGKNLLFYITALYTCLYMCGFDSLTIPMALGMLGLAVALWFLCYLFVDFKDIYGCEDSIED